MLSLGRQEDLTLPLALADARVQRGQTLFLDNAVSRCNVCHFNAGANANPAIFGADAGNRNFNTGVEDLAGHPEPRAGRPKRRRATMASTFLGTARSTRRPLVEAADTPPFFHNNARATLEEAVAFYNSDAFNNSPSGQAGRIALQTTTSERHRRLPAGAQCAREHPPERGLCARGDGAWVRTRRRAAAAGARGNPGRHPRAGRDRPACRRRRRLEPGHAQRRTRARTGVPSRDLAAAPSTRCNGRAAASCRRRPRRPHHHE